MSPAFESVRLRCTELLARCRARHGRATRELRGALESLLSSFDALRDGDSRRGREVAAPPGPDDGAPESLRAAVLDASPDAVVTIDLDGIVIDANTVAESLFGYSRAEAVGRSFDALGLPARLREPARAHLDRYRATGRSELFGRRLAVRAARADGTEFPLEVLVAPVPAHDPPLVALYMRDVSLPGRAYAQPPELPDRLRSLATTVLLAEETERRRLAAELHDGLSQSIALARIKYAELRRSSADPLGRSLEEIASLIDQADRTARSITFELSPPILYQLGLEPAVQWLVENIQERYGLRILVENDGQPKPADEKVRVILFRSIRELLINAAKHSGARTVRVRLSREADQLSAAVEDDGVGMPSGAEPCHGYGLFSIRERMRDVGGSMLLDSAPGRGTTVRLCAPLGCAGSAREGDAA